MATAKNSGTKRASKPKTQTVVDDIVEAVVSEPISDDSTSVVIPKTMPPKRVEVSLTDLVCVQSCFHGDLFYKSKRNGSIVEWQTFGEEQYMDVDELMYMRNTQPTFFKEQWIRLVGDNADNVFTFLHLDRYCKNNLKFDNFDDIFEMEPDTIKSVVKEFAPSLRDSFARRAMELIDSEDLTDLKIIKAIEVATGCKLIQ